MSLLAEPNDGSSRGRAMRGLANELAVGWLLQPELLEPTPPRDLIVEKPSHVVIPASLRQDNHRRPAERVDLNVYALSAKGRRTPVQVGTIPKEVDPNAFQIATTRDLDLGPNAGAQNLLGQIYQREIGDRTGTDNLIQISRTLLDNMTQYEQSRH
jgi:hypothetical protein